MKSIQVDYGTNGVPVCGSNITQCDNGMCGGEITVAISSGCTLNADSIVTVDVIASSVLGTGPATTLRIGMVQYGL